MDKVYIVIDQYKNILGVYSDPNEAEEVSNFIINGRTLLVVEHEIIKPS